MDSSSISEWSDHSIAECERACPAPVYATAHTIITVFRTQFSRLVGGNAAIVIAWIRGAGFSVRGDEERSDAYI
jgi:hypothetical protein